MGPLDGLVRCRPICVIPPPVRAALDGADATVNRCRSMSRTVAANLQSDPCRGRGPAGTGRRRRRLRRLVHISGIGSDARSTSAYIRARGEGEDAVRAGFPGATILRPSVMFGPDDAFLTTLVGLVERLPVVPLFGDGSTRLRACARRGPRRRGRDPSGHLDPPAPTYELGGPEVHCYRALLELVARHVGRRRLLLPVPFPLWTCLPRPAGFFPARLSPRARWRSCGKTMSPIPACRASPALGISQCPSRQSFVGAWPRT